MDEPWETQAGRFTVLYMAQHSGGRSETAFVSMADFLRDGMLDEDVRLLANATGTFAPPPWLPLEVCSPHGVHLIVFTNLCSLLFDYLQYYWSNLTTTVLHPANSSGSPRTSVQPY